LTCGDKGGYLSLAPKCDSLRDGTDAFKFSILNSQFKVQPTALPAAAAAFPREKKT
jgi:hypothetical protein